MTITKFTPADAGCLFDGHNGIYIYGMIVDLAVECGMELSDHDSIERRWAYDHEVDNATLAQCFEHLVDPYGGLADKATEWLNENVAPEGFRFDWSDGEFYFMSDEWWEENE